MDSPLLSPTVVVYGWYNQGNLGDDLFVEAFRNLFPNFNFIFTDYLTTELAEIADAVFIGGGSFLSEPLNISAPALETLYYKKVFYIGVGTETDFHPAHVSLMSLAKLIATRTSANLDKVKKINSNTIVIPDLVYYLSSPIISNKVSKSVLVIPNIVVVPKWNDPQWKYVAWEYFKSEFSQVLDNLVDRGYTVHLFPMCINSEQDDRNAAIELSNKMVNRNNKLLLEKTSDLKSTIELLSKYEAIVTQRYHGAVLSNLAQTPCLTIHHHDKLKNIGEQNLSYYGINKAQVLVSIETAIKSKILPIDRNIFEDLRKTVISLL